jgi:hypothetical protein
MLVNLHLWDMAHQDWQPSHSLYHLSPMLAKPSAHFKIQAAPMSLSSLPILKFALISCNVVYPLCLPPHSSLNKDMANSTTDGNSLLWTIIYAGIHCTRLSMMGGS